MYRYMASGNSGGGFIHGDQEMRFGERSFSCALSLICTFCIFLAPMLISVEGRANIMSSVQVFVISAEDANEGPIAESAGKKYDQPEGVDKRRDDNAGQPEPRPASTIPEPPAFPRVRHPEPIELPDFSQTLNAAADIPDSIFDQIPAHAGNALVDTGAPSVSGAGDGSSGTGEGSSGSAESGKGMAKVYTASWAPSMDFSKDNKFYPPGAAAARVEGVAWLKCKVVRRDRVRNCHLLGESPRGYGFGEAALKTEPGLRIRLHDRAGRRVFDEWTIVTSTFSLADLASD